MVNDKVELEINGQKIDKFISYQIESNIFVADDAFSLELAAPLTEVARGSRCRLYVNGELELDGLVDSISSSYSKDSSKLTLQGRDLMGLLVDSYVEDFITLENIKLKALAASLLKKVPYIKTKDIIYGKGNKSLVIELEKDDEYDSVQIEPGQTVFDVLKTFARSRGLIMFSTPSGKIVFGEPVSKGRADYSLTDENIIEAEVVDDISKGYSKVIVIGQQQGADYLEAEDINTTGEIEDKSYPFYKPLVEVSESDGANPKKEAQLLMNKKIFDSFQLSYKTYGHSQDGKNYHANALCHIHDGPHNINGTYLCYSRTFELSKEGSFTNFKLAPRGVLPE